MTEEGLDNLITKCSSLIYLLEKDGENIDVTAGNILEFAGEANKLILDYGGNLSKIPKSKIEATEQNELNVNPLIEQLKAYKSILEGFKNKTR